MKQDISARQSVIRVALQADGWAVCVDDELDEWWCYECWRLDSLWSPRKARVYLSFLIDPHPATASSQRNVIRVWAARASAGKPVNWQDGSNESVLIFGRHWRRQLPEFVRYIGSLREA